jgi:hypothetical protein
MAGTEPTSGDNPSGQRPNSALENMQVPDLAQLVWHLAELHGSLASGLAAALSQTSLTPDQFRVIAAIAAIEAPTMGQLTVRLDLANSSLSRIVDSLEAKNLVSRQQKPSDRRRITVTLTTEGENRFRTAIQILDDWQQSSQESLAYQLNEKLQNLLSRLALS